MLPGQGYRIPQGTVIDVRVDLSSNAFDLYSRCVRFKSWPGQNIPTGFSWFFYLPTYLPTYKQIPRENLKFDPDHIITYPFQFIYSLSFNITDMESELPTVSSNKL
jgi:hypothetical protein